MDEESINDLFHAPKLTSLPTTSETFAQTCTCCSSYESENIDWQDREGTWQAEQYLILKKITLDCNFSWKNHIATITQRTSKYIPLLPKMRCTYSFKCLKRKHNCLFYSKLINGKSIWGLYKEIALKPLVLLHKKILRAMEGCQFIYSTHELCVKFLKLIFKQI